MQQCGSIMCFLKVFTQWSSEKYRKSANLSFINILDAPLCFLCLKLNLNHFVKVRNVRRPLEWKWKKKKNMIFFLHPTQSCSFLNNNVIFCGDNKITWKKYLLNIYVRTENLSTMEFQNLKWAQRESWTKKDFTITMQKWPC